MIGDALRVRVWGPWACFTRPEFHVERVSYPVMTPSAARGVLEAILMQPIEKPDTAQRGNKIGFRWHVLRIGLLKKGLLVPIRRNELAYPAHGFEGYNVSAVRAQRSSLVLKDVEYLVEGVIEIPEGCGDPGGSAPIAKYQGMFIRRAQNGQCYHRPYLGCREFPCHFEWAPGQEPEDERGHRIHETFGPMLRDFDFDPVWRCWPAGNARPATWSKNGRKVSPVPKPFVAEAINGWITVATVHESDGKREIRYP
ncbi:MAG: CRISPR-associated protein Cas5 [Candidatus Riflebacteria bacterium]|nr:CRISPR-associated protein Cas5 [Candidatus Riflebacteria bacterium]